VIYLSATSTTLLANGISTTTISSNVIYDLRGWPLLEGTLLTVISTDTNGNPIGYLPADQSTSNRGKQLSVNSDGKLIFDFRAGTTAGVATINVYVGYGKSALEGLLGTINITLQ